MTRLRIYLPYTFFFGVLLVIGLSSWLFARESVQLPLERAHALNTSWTLIEQDSQRHVAVTLPSRLDVAVNTPVTAEIILPDTFNTAQRVLLRSSLANIEVFLDGTSLYAVDFAHQKTYASLWHIIELPEGLEGAVLTVVLSSPYPAMSININEVYYGSSAALYRHLFSTYILRLAIGALTLILGITILIVSLFFLPKTKTTHAYLGLFGVFFGFWLLGESRLLQWFTGNTFLLGSLSYLSIAVFPIPPLIFFAYDVLPKWRRVFWGLTVVQAVNAVMIYALHLLGQRAFFETVPLSIGLLAISFTVALVLLLLELRKNYALRLMKILIVMGVLAFFTVLEVVKFASRDIWITSTFAAIGLGLVMVFIFINYITFVIQRYKISFRNEFYEILAYIDPLTGAKNRHAFERDFEALFANPKKRETLRLLYFDLDDLKYINDQYGHLEGDAAIKQAYAVLAKTMASYGECYRIGGDEFACLSYEMDDAVHQFVTHAISELFTTVDAATPYPFRVSMGSTKHALNQDEKPSDMLKRSDTAMYADKRRFKKHLE